LFGPPAILFYDASGDEKVSRRVIGFMKAERFLERLQ
jgi:thiol:disulfide interchange protein DsbD